VKKTTLSAYGNVRTVGLNAININEGDELIDVQITSGEDEIILASKGGKAIRFKEQDARQLGRATAGVRGLRLRGDDIVIGMVVVRPESTLLVVSENGMGKRSEVDTYRLQKRGGMGVINLKVSEKTGAVVAIKAVTEDEQLMVITRNGVVNRQRVSEISVIGRATQGVKLVNLDKGDTVMDVARVVIDDEDENRENGENGSLDGDAPENGEAVDATGAEAIADADAEVSADASGGEGASEEEGAPAAEDAGDEPEMTDTDSAEPEAD
jgi:DNA gyrase subunit A